MGGGRGGWTDRDGRWESAEKIFSARAGKEERSVHARVCAAEDQFVIGVSVRIFLYFFFLFESGPALDRRRCRRGEKDEESFSERRARTSIRGSPPPDRREKN